MYECCPTRVVEIESPDALRAHVEEAESLRDVVVQGLDLTDAVDQAVGAIIDHAPTRVH